MKGITPRPCVKLTYYCYKTVQATGAAEADGDAAGGASTATVAAADAVEAVATAADTEDVTPAQEPEKMQIDSWESVSQQPSW